MPLRAKQNETAIFAFNFDSDSWLSLRAQSIKMHCCDARAVLKTSNRGTQFFAHYRIGDCPHGDESAEHVYVKNLIALAAIRSGWHVETEMKGDTPAGDKWTADVYCVKGKAKLAFEVQRSYQTRDEFERRQKIFDSSGIRCAWLYRVKGNKLHFVDDIPYEYETPVFGMKSRSKQIKDLYIPQFDEPLESFIEGMLQGKLVWSPQEGDRLRAEVIPHYAKCWKCEEETGVILGLSIKDVRNAEIGFNKFSEEDIPEFILRNGVAKCLSKFRIGQLKTRYSKTKGEGYVSNGCYHCDAIMGNFFMSKALLEYQEDFPDPIYSFEYIHGQSGPLTESNWYFNNRRSAGVF